MALMAALDAFSIDAVLPALNQIALQLNVLVPNHKQYVVTALFLGFAAGVLIYGFVADMVGRRVPVMVGFGLYLIGTLVCVFAMTFHGLLLGRVLQGLGAAGPYVLSVTIVRDRYQGRQMARALSLIMMVFIGVPMIAPFVGQGILLFAPWRGIFMVFLVFALLIMSWFWVRQPETLKVENRRAVNPKEILDATRSVLWHPQTLRYLLAFAALSGAFIAYLSTAQQVFQDIYLLGAWFPVAFASLASLFGLGSYLNARWVESVGMSRLVHYAQSTLFVASLVFLLIFTISDFQPPLWAYVVYSSIMMPVFAFSFGNTTSLALEPQGHIAGAASSLVNSLGTAIAIMLATIIGYFLDANVLPVVAGFGILSLVTILLNYPQYKQA